MKPIELFTTWYNEEKKLAKTRIPGACCLSTIGTDGYPNARFVSLKDVVKNNFIVTGSLASKKGAEIIANNKVAITFWWTETERQVRIQGSATKIPEQLANKYFNERNRDSQLVSIVSEQGKEIDNIDDLNKKYNSLQKQLSGNHLIRPDNWGGWMIKPVRMEFLKFKTTRFHHRKLFELENGQWKTKQLQP
jgi:pyridoxamine 5'-phosphate oxidase